jgi:hypothetical protein
MGIEPTREALPERENTGFRVMRSLKCDGSVNFRGMWGNVGMRWLLSGRDFASRPVDAPGCRNAFRFAVIRKTSHRSHFSADFPFANV